MIYNEWSYWMTMTGSEKDIITFINTLMIDVNVPADCLVHGKIKHTNNPDEYTCSIQVNENFGTISEWTTHTDDITDSLKNTPDLEVLLESINEEFTSEHTIELWHHGKYICDAARLLIKSADELRAELSKL